MITAGSESPAHRWINPDAESQGVGFIENDFIDGQLTQYVPLDTQCSDDDIKTKSSEAVVLQEGQQESDPEENHHVDVIEQRIVGVPFLLNFQISSSSFQILFNLTPRSIIEFDISSIENEKDDLNNNKQGNVEILPPGPVEQKFYKHFRLSYLGLS